MEPGIVLIVIGMTLMIFSFSKGLSGKKEQLRRVVSVLMTKYSWPWSLYENTVGSGIKLWELRTKDLKTTVVVCKSRKEAEAILKIANEIDQDNKESEAFNP